MTSALRELIWLEIQQNPGSTVAQIEKSAGAMSTFQSFSKLVHAQRLAELDK